MDEEAVFFRKIPIKPFACLGESKDLISGEYWLFVGLSAVAYLMGALAPMGILMGAMMCGLTRCFFNRIRGREVSLNALFKGLDDFLESLVATLMIFALMMAVLLPFQAILFFGLISMGVFGQALGKVPQQNAAAGAAMFGFSGFLCCSM